MLNTAMKAPLIGWEGGVFLIVRSVAPEMGY